MDRKNRHVNLREFVGLALLILLLLLGLLSSWYLRQQQETITAALEDGAWLALSGQWTQARQQAETARELWQRRWNLWASFGDHTPMEEIDDQFAQLTIYAAAGEKTDFAAACASLARQVTAMADAHRLSWWNVL